MKAVIVSMQLAPSSWSPLHAHTGTGASTASGSITTHYHQSSLTKWKQLMLNSGMGRIITTSCNGLGEGILG